MRKILSLLCVVVLSVVNSQTKISYSSSPLFSECKTMSIEKQKACFESTFQQLIYKTFSVPDAFKNKATTDVLKVLFEVDEKGVFKLIFVEAVHQNLKDELKRVFATLPKITPATFNGKPTYMQYTTKINIPFQNNIQFDVEDKMDLRQNQTHSYNEIDSINKSLKPYKDDAFKSQLNIPFSHSYYSQFDKHLNGVGANSHTASKPFIYNEVSKYYNFSEAKVSLNKSAETWFGRKLWNEHMVAVKGKQYWFTIDPIWDLQLGKDTEGGSTYNNTRGVFITAGLGSKFNFSTSFYESQGRFASYFNDYAEQLKPFGPDPAIVPGRGVAKRFKTDAYDYPVAEAYLSYTPNSFLNIQFGHGKNFIGDGYRSLFLSDVASPSPFFKTNLNFWKIKYTSTWLWGKDVRDAVVQDGAFLTKYIANHYLSWNVSKRLNLGFFESVVWANSNGRGFDVNYLNPLIFLRAVEFGTGQDAGNSILGLSTKYKLNNKVNVYGQYVIDEFSLSDVGAGSKSWKNKFGFQLGAKYYNAFNVEGLFLQAEYNQVRPYAYSHNTVVLNYAHNNQPLAHLWGNNFREFIAIGRYNYKRWFADAKLIFGERGFDFRNSTDNFYYGGDVFGNENDRPSDTGIQIGQGNKTSIFQAEFMAGYLINPTTNLKAFLNLNYRNFNPTEQTNLTQKSNTTWFSVGVRTNIFNWYNDF